MNKTMKKKCEETTTVTLYIKHALFGWKRHQVKLGWGANSLTFI